MTLLEHQQTEQQTHSEVALKPKPHSDHQQSPVHGIHHHLGRALRLSRLCNALQFMAMTTFVGLGAFAIHTFITSAQPSSFDWKRRKKIHKHNMPFEQYPRGDFSSFMSSSEYCPTQFEYHVMNDNHSNSQHMSVIHRPPQYRISTLIKSADYSPPNLGAEEMQSRIISPLNQISEAAGKGVHETLPDIRTSMVARSVKCSSRSKHRRSKSYTDCNADLSNINERDPDLSNIAEHDTTDHAKGPYPYHSELCANSATSKNQLARNEPATRATNRASKNRVKSKSYDWASSSDQAEISLRLATQGQDLRANLHSPPLPPLDLITGQESVAQALMQRRESFKRAILQSLAPWRQTSAAASTPLLASSTSSQIYNSSPSHIRHENLIYLSPAAAYGTTPGYNHVDELQAQSDAFIHRRQEQWRLQRLKSLQRVANS